jgi:hypothetical protein
LLAALLTTLLAGLLIWLLALLARFLIRLLRHKSNLVILEAAMNVNPLIIYSAELALAAIILFYVVEMLTMPNNMKRVCQGLIILIAILSVVGQLLGSAPPPASHIGPLAPNSPSNPMIR